MNTVSLYNRVLRAAYHYALDAEIISMDKRPFRKSFTGREKTRKRAVESDIIKRLTKLRLSSNSWLSFSRDLFLFSIYMQGMPFVDMAHTIFMKNIRMHGEMLVSTTFPYLIFIVIQRAQRN